MKKSNRSTIGILAAVLLALVGGLLLWQSSGDSDSEAAEQPTDGVEVLIAVRDIPAGQSASDMASEAAAWVRAEVVPKETATFGVLSTVDQLADLGLGRNVVSHAITAGSQLTGADFVVPGSTSIAALDDVAENLFQMTVALEPQRALGGFVRAGQKVAVIGSFDPQGEDPGQTVVILHEVEVTNVTAEQVLTAEQQQVDPLAPTLAPNSRMFVTFGVKVADLERLTYAVEFGQIWLAYQGPKATVDESVVRERDNVVVAVPDQDSQGAKSEDPAGK